MSPINVLIVLAMLATAGALVMGIVSMLRGGEYDRVHSGQFMTARIGLQGATLVLLFVVFALA